MYITHTYIYLSLLNPYFRLRFSHWDGLPRGRSPGPAADQAREEAARGRGGGSHGRGHRGGAGKSQKGRRPGENVGILLGIWGWVNTYRYIFSGMNIHLPAILMFTRGIGFWPIPISIPIDSESKLALTAGEWQDLALVFRLGRSLGFFENGNKSQTNGYPMGNVMVIFHGIYKQEYGIWDEFENGWFSQIAIFMRRMMINHCTWGRLIFIHFHTNPDVDVYTPIVES